jgi:hypothetical protein
VNFGFDALVVIPTPFFRSNVQVSPGKRLVLDACSHAVVQLWVLLINASDDHPEVGRVGEGDVTAGVDLLAKVVEARLVRVHLVEFAASDAHQYQ